MPRKKKFKYTFDIIQAIIFPFMLMVVAGFFISQGWVKAEDVEVVWTVVIITMIATIGAIIVASKLSD